MGWAYARHKHGPYYPAATGTAAIEELGGAGGWIGRDRVPIQPEEFFHAEDWLESVSCSDEYNMECADGWDASTQEQREELDEIVRAAMAAWLDRHGLRPRFFVVEKIKRIRPGKRVEE